MEMSFLSSTVTVCWVSVLKKLEDTRLVGTELMVGGSRELPEEQHLDEKWLRGGLLAGRGRIKGEEDRCRERRFCPRFARERYNGQCAG